MKHATTAKINLANLKHNFNTIKNLAPQSKILAMVKSNAYGHGATKIANVLDEADAFGVASLEEALELREAKINKPILLMKSFRDQDELLIANQNNLQITIFNDYQLKILEETNLINPLTVWLKIDTGMHRLGFLPDQVATAHRSLMQNPQVQKPIHLITHFAKSDNPADPKTDEQINLFKEVTENLSGIKSIFNSAATLCQKQFFSNWVRPGIALYGASPLINKTAAELNLKPVMTLCSTIVDIKLISKNEAVGYGGDFICPEDMLVGIVNCGYGDGYPRSAKTGTPVLVNGKRCQIIGRISMDMLAVDLRECKKAKITDPVILWGENLPAEEIAKCAGTIAYELFCRLTRRVQFEYI